MPTVAYPLFLCPHLSPRNILTFFKREFGVRELTVRKSFYRFAGFRKTRKNKKIQEKMHSTFSIFSYFLLFFLIFPKPPKA